jgi:hypothetical protein
MTNSRAHLDKAVDALTTAVDAKRDWPADLDESAPRWAELFEQLGEIARWVMQGAVIVRADAENLASDQARPLAAAAAWVVSALNATTSSRPEVDHMWRVVAATFTQARTTMPASQGHQSTRETNVAGVVHEAAQAVRKAASQRLAPGDVVAVLTVASSVCEAMCGLVMRISVALEQRAKDYPDLAGIARSMRRGIHNRYRDAGEYFAAAAATAEQIMTRWPDRWPGSV